MSTSDTTVDEAERDHEATEVVLRRLRSEVSSDTLFHCVSRFVVAGFLYPFIAAPCIWIYSTIRSGVSPASVGGLFMALFGGIFLAAFLGIVLGVIATVVGIFAAFIVDLANRNFRFPLSVVGCATAMSSVTVFLLLAIFGDAKAGAVFDPGFWLIGVVLGTLLCQWTMIRTVNWQLPREIYNHARKANVDPHELTEFLSRPTKWQFALRDLIIATVWIAVVFAALRALRLTGVQLEWYVLFSCLLHAPMCWFMTRFGESN